MSRNPSDDERFDQQFAESDDERADRLRAARQRASSSPYPWCRTPAKCAGKGYCPNDPACNN